MKGIHPIGLQEEESPRRDELPKDSRPAGRTPREPSQRDGWPETGGRDARPTGIPNQTPTALGPTYTAGIVKCDTCDNEATVHEVNVVGGKAVERHLCEACAREAGLVASAPMPVTEILQKIAGAQAGPAASGAPGAPSPGSTACEVCGMSFAEFKSTGRLGCPECYKALEEQLKPILDRAHQGAVHHVGKVPKRMMQQAGEGSELHDREAAIAAAEARAAQIRRLREDLERAVKSEAYERAAEMRDRLRQLQQGVEPAEDAG